MNVGTSRSFSGFLDIYVNEDPFHLTLRVTEYSLSKKIPSPLL